MPGRAGAALTTPGRARTARWSGSGKRDGKRSTRGTGVRHPLDQAPARTWWIWAGCGAHSPPKTVGNSRGGGHEPPGRLRGRSAAYSQRCRRGIVGLLLRRATHSEHGNRSGSCPALRHQRRWRGWAHRPPIGPGRDGAAVVLRAGESPRTWGRAAAVSRSDWRLQCRKTRPRTGTDRRLAGADPR